MDGPDIFVANGHVFPQADAVKGLAPYREPMFLFRNNRDGHLRCDGGCRVEQLAGAIAGEGRRLETWTTTGTSIF